MKTKKCELCGHIIRFWNQKSPDNPHNLISLGCPNAKKEDRTKMRDEQIKYYRKQRHI